MYTVRKKKTKNYCSLSYNTRLFIAVSITQFLFTELKNQIETQVNELKTQIEGKCVMQ